VSSTHGSIQLHRELLQLEDSNARIEDDAYSHLASRFHELASTMRQTASQMAKYRDLPAAAHDERGFGERQRHAFERFVGAQGQLLTVLRAAAARDEAMLASMASD
jgi:hypothetical protein